MSSGLFRFGSKRPTSSGSQNVVGRKGMITSSSLGAKPKEMTKSTFDNYRNTIYKICGIYFTDSKKYLLESRILKRINTLNLETFEKYLELISSPKGRSELNSLFEAITINETYFFRAEAQFKALINNVIPDIFKNHPHQKTFKFWSAASSSGEEAYTIAILIKEKLMQKYPGVTFQIHASDLDNNVIANAKKGIYKNYAVRNMPPEYQRKYFVKKDGLYHLSDDIKKMVKFQNINLYDSVTMRTMKNFDVIFCCNVLIYFDIPSKQKVVSHLYDSLNNNAYLFIGYSESLHGVSKSFKLIHLPKAMTYKKEISS